MLAGQALAAAAAAVVVAPLYAPVGLDYLVCSAAPACREDLCWARVWVSGLLLPLLSDWCAVGAQLHSPQLLLLCLGLLDAAVVECSHLGPHNSLEGMLAPFQKPAGRMYRSEKGNKQSSSVAFCVL